MIANTLLFKSMQPHVGPFHGVSALQVIWEQQSDTFVIHTKSAYQIHYPLLRLHFPISHKTNHSHPMRKSDANEVTSNQTIVGQRCAIIHGRPVRMIHVSVSPILLSVWLRLIFLKPRIQEGQRDCVETLSDLRSVTLLSELSSQSWRYELCSFQTRAPSRSCRFFLKMYVKILPVHISSYATKTVYVSNVAAFNYCNW